MNEADTRAEYIDPLLNKAGWSSGLFRLKREYPIWPGRIEVGGKRKNPLKADYVLFYNHRKVAVVEAKPYDEDVSEGVAQAKNYASLLQLDYAFCTNGKEIYKIDLFSSKENLIENFPDPNSLVNKIKKENDILKKFNNIPYEVSSDKNTYYFQENAIDNALKKISNNEKRILLTLATGTGKTFIAFQIVWKLFHSNWNISGDNRKPRVLFLTDRNFLADQAFNDFSSFESDCLVRIKTDKISKEGEVPTNGNIFFTIFQKFTFLI